MKRTFLSLSMLVAVASLMLGNTNAEARWRCCRGGYGYGGGYQNAYYGNGYQQGYGYQQAGTYDTTATTGSGCGVTAAPASAPAAAPAPPQEVAPAPVNQAPAAPAPGT